MQDRYVSPGVCRTIFSVLHVGLVCCLHSDPLEHLTYYETELSGYRSVFINGVSGYFPWRLQNNIGQKNTIHVPMKQVLHYNIV